MKNIKIVDRVTKIKIDWFTLEDNEVEKEIKDIRSNTYYDDCDIYVNGEIVTTTLEPGTKKDIINAVIEKSYSVSKEDMKKIIYDVTNNNYMQIKDSKDIWSKILKEVNKLPNGTGGNVVLFVGSNVEHYRQK